MEAMLKDKRFAHIAKDPKFRRIPKSERKVKIDKRFQSMFKDKRFTVKYTVDKRGRPVNQTSTENLKKFYDIPSNEEDSSSEESDSNTQNKQLKKQKSEKHLDESKRKYVTNDNEKNEEDQENETETSEDEENYSEDENFSSNGKLLLLKQPANDVVAVKNNKESDEGLSIENEYKENERQLTVRRGNEKKLSNEVKKKLRDLTVDYARGEGVILSDSSSDEESSEYEDDEEEIEHNWGELDKEADTTEEITHRLAICNMDWDRIKATDLMILFNSFLPTGGLIRKVTIYPSEFGLQRMKEEETKGPIELVESKSQKESDDEDTNVDNDNQEGSSYHMEKLRKYQLNRLRYYYAVAEFDSADTANKVYTECDGLEYESSSTKIDLRFIPDDMTFDQEPKESCDKLPDLTKYKPRQFTTTALQQVKVDLTWDETNPERKEISQKLSSGKLDDLDKNDIQAYLASGTSEDESEDEMKKQLEGIHDSSANENTVDRYKELLKSIEQAEEEKKNKEVELEFTWGIGSKEKTEKLVKEKMKAKENLTPFEQYLEKRKAKKIAKREQKKNLSKNDVDNESDSEDSIPSDIDMNNPYFAEELKGIKSKSKKRKNTSKASDSNSDDDDKERRKQAELELLLLDENQEDNKRHFSMKRIEEAESLTKSKRKRFSKKKKELQEEASKDNFEVDVQDPRFSALFTSYHYNIDPTDPHYRKTKGTEAIIQEKIKRRNENDNINIEKNSTCEENSRSSSKVNTELNTLVKSIKKNTQNLHKYIK